MCGQLHAVAALARGLKNPEQEAGFKRLGEEICSQSIKKPNFRNSEPDGARAARSR